jgi:hypothetical protein
VTQLARALRIDKRSFLSLMDGIDYWPDGRSHRYFIPDVAARICARRETTPTVERRHAVAEDESYG